MVNLPPPPCTELVRLASAARLPPELVVALAAAGLNTALQVANRCDTAADLEPFMADLVTEDAQHFLDNCEKVARTLAKTRMRNFTVGEPVLRATNPSPPVAGGGAPT